ncbi:MAG: TatD family hydrolase, partial [Muribaculaceae bacterium]|nr:TatD family hydrolase [Muribaculaceae bacterium]
SRGLGDVSQRQAPLFTQIIIIKQMIALSENLGQPLLINDVKAHEIIIQTHKDLRPSQPWIIHGFRAKPTVAQMMLREGFYLSFGELFNPLTVHNAPADLILAETDESKLPIKEIIHFLSDARGTDLTHIVAENADKLIGL